MIELNNVRLELIKIDNNTKFGFRLSQNFQFSELFSQ